MNFNLLGDEEYKKLLSIFMCNIEITPDSKLFTSGNYLKPYGDKAGSIAIGYGLDLKVNSIFTITDLYKKVLGETWQLSDNEKDIITKLQNKEITTSQALEKFNSLATLSLDLQTQDNAYKLYYETLKKYEDKVINQIPNSYERIALVSRAYNHYGSLIKGAVKQQNRFLIWFLLRYTANTSNGIELLGLTKRRWWESEIFGLINNENMFSSCVNIFTQLNIGKFNQQILYNHITKYETKNMTAQNIKIFKSDATSRNFDMYFTFQYNLIQVTLQPYLTYLNNLTNKTFTLENIYCIQSFYGVLGANKLDTVSAINKILRERFNKDKPKDNTKQDSPSNNNTKSNSQDNFQFNDGKINDSNTTQTKQDDLNSQAQELTQILILYPNPTPSPIQIIQPKNTFLTLVVAKNAKIDCENLILNQCEINYLEYNENEKEAENNPKLTKLETGGELTLELKNESDYEVSKDNRLYFINKDTGILKIALNDKKQEAVELYSFAKENEYQILKDKASQILDIKLKLKNNENTPLNKGGNFNLTLDNLIILDKDFNPHQNIQKVYLHNCENRRIYENLYLNSKEDKSFQTSFNIDLIQERNSNFFKRDTKCIIATQGLSQFSTEEIHHFGNVAVVSLSSKDKQGTSYTFTPRVSAQEFKEEELKMRGEGEDLSEIEVVASGNDVKMEKISDYSLNIIKQMAKASNNPKVTITSTTRNEMEQAEAMYNNCSKPNGIRDQYKLYGVNGDKVIKVYEDLHKTKTRQEVIQAMYEKIIEVGPEKVSNHYRKDTSKRNVIDISVRRLKNPQDFKREIEKQQSQGKIQIFHNETKNNCFHIEINQPQNKDQ